VDTKAIAKEIVEIRHRLDEFEDQHEESYTQEQSHLRDRLRHLQDMLSGKVRDAPQDSPAEPDSVHYHPPA
jgi:transcription elongation GreA/GreB family factor